MKFEDLLNQPLPSKVYEESGDMNFDKEFEKNLSNMMKEETCQTEGCKSEACKTEGCRTEGCKTEGCRTEACRTEGCKTEGCRTEESDGIDDLDAIDDLLSEITGDGDIASDEEIDQLSKELSINGSLEDEKKDDDDDDDEKEDDDDDDEKEDSNPAAASYNPETPAEPLEGKDDEEADNMLNVIATPIIVEEACTVEEVSNFLESGESEIAVNEGLVMESDIDHLVADLSNTDYYTESVFAAPGKKFKMTKQARLKQLFELSLQIEARAHHDPLYGKLMKAYKVERTIKAQWRKKYGALASKRAKKYLKRLIASKSKTLSSAAARIIGK